MTRVVNIRTGEPFDVYVGRANGRKGLKASPFANPFEIGRDGTRAEVIAKFGSWLRHGYPEPRPDARALGGVAPSARRAEILARLPELKGRTLGCWCAPEACHGDVLAELAEGATA